MSRSDGVRAVQSDSVVDKTFELLHVNKMNEKMLASPAMVDGIWYSARMDT